MASTGAGATTVSIDKACLLTGTLCNASIVLTAAGVTDATFVGGVLTLDVNNASYSLPSTLSNKSGNTLNQAGNNTTFTGVFSDAGKAAGTITIANVNPGNGAALTTGSVIFAAANTYTGVTTINSGATLALSGTGKIENSSDVADSGRFDISGASGGVSITGLTGTNGASVILGSNTLTLSNPTKETFSGTIEGTGGITVAGGTQRLGGANKFTGATTVSPAGNANATLALIGTGDIGSSSGITVDNKGKAQGTFDISGITASGTTIQTLSGSGSVALGAKLLTLSNASGIFTGVISGNNKANGLTISGGTEALMGANTFKGSTTVSSGATLTGTGSVAGAVVNNGTVRPFDTVSNKAGTFTIGGSYSRTGGQSDVLSIAIGGLPASGNYSKLAVKGAVSLGTGVAGGGDSTLNIDTNTLGFSFPVGDTTYTDILTFDSVSGAFTKLSYNGTACSAGSGMWTCGAYLTFKEFFDPTSLDLVVTQVPEPSAIALLAAGLLGLMGIQRRRAQ